MAARRARRRAFPGSWVRTTQSDATSVGRVWRAALFTWKCRPSSHKNSRPRMATLTCSGNAVAFYSAFLPATTRRALGGGRYSSVLIWSETFANSGSVFLSRRSSVSGRCSRMAKAASSMRSALLIVSMPTGGARWEGFVIEALIAAAPSATRPYFFPNASKRRSRSGAGVHPRSAVGDRNQEEQCANYLEGASRSHPTTLSPGVGSSYITGTQPIHARWHRSHHIARCH